MNKFEKIDSLINLKKSLPDCKRKREIEEEIKNLKLELQNNSVNSTEPSILVRHSGKVVGRLDYNKSENAWVFKSNDGSSVEIGFYWTDVTTWAALNGYRVKVESI